MRHLMKIVPLLGMLLNYSGTVLSNENLKKFNVGIIQISDHQALNSAKKGALDELKKSKISFHVEDKNAQGNMVVANQIVTNFKFKNHDVVFAIGTPVAQLSKRYLKNKPIVFTAVTDPVSSKLVKKESYPEANVTGVSDRPPVNRQLELIKTIQPNAKKIGFIFNPSESNSVTQKASFEKECQNLGLRPVLRSIQNTNDITLAVNYFVGKVDAIYVPQDNTVASAINPLIDLSIKNKIPLYPSYDSPVEQGAMASLSIDYYLLGTQAGKMIIKLLEGKNVNDIPIETQKELNVSINLDTVRKLQMKIPDHIIKKAIIYKK